MLSTSCHDSMRIQYNSITAARSNRHMYRDMRFGKSSRDFTSLEVVDHGPNTTFTEYWT